MRNLLVASLLVAAASLAHADSISTEATPVHPTNNMYVALGGQAGGESGGYALVGGTLDVGYHLDDSGVWLHGKLAGGPVGRLLDSGQGYFMQASGGVETHLCAASWACVIPGVDVGMQRTSFDSVDWPLFGGSTTTTHMETSEVVVIPRLQGDFGGALRVRPGIEAVMGQNGVSGADVTLAVAYRW